MKIYLKELTFILFVFIIISCTKHGSPDELRLSEILEHKADSAIQPYVDSSKIAGFVIAAVKRDQTLLLKSYGYADLEYDVPMPVDASFEIGSVTKQFTAAAILKLVSQNRLSLDDDLTEYLVYDTRGYKIPVRRLLDHTSGIKGFTELPEYEQFSMFGYPRDTLLRIVEKAGFDFEPGEAMIYNNTAYFMLGLIIEKVTGMSYSEYISSELFEEAGMTDSYYCDERIVRKKRAHGYDTGDKGKLIRAGYLDHTWPYSAGSLCSTAEDLVKWNKAIHGGKILTDKAYNELISPGYLNDGTFLRYAKGLAIYEDKGRKVIAHGGGINGFLSDSRYYPDEDVIIVTLINSTGSVNPGDISNLLTDVLIYPKEKDIVEFSGDLSMYEVV